MPTEGAGRSFCCAPKQGLLSTHVLLLVLLLLVVVRFAAGHVLLLFLLGRGWFAGERHRRTEAKREKRCECDETCIASHGNLLRIGESMKLSHRNTRCYGSTNHSVILMRVTRLSGYGAEQG